MHGLTIQLGLFHRIKPHFNNKSVSQEPTANKKNEVARLT